MRLPPKTAAACRWSILATVAALAIIVGGPPRRALAASPAGSTAIVQHTTPGGGQDVTRATSFDGDETIARQAGSARS